MLAVDQMRYSTRWQVSTKTIRRWYETNHKQFIVLKTGMSRRRNVDSEFHESPIKSLSRFVQHQGIFIKDIVEHSGLTKQTLNRLAKKRNTHRLRDLVAGTAALVAARNRATLSER